MTQLVWLITGCSSGFGQAFVHALLERGDKVIETSRKAANSLCRVTRNSAAYIHLDVTAPQETLDKKIEEAIAIYGHIDVLVNNAGYAQMGFVEVVSQKEWQDQFNTNFFGSLNVTKALLPHFRQRRSGKIAFMGSTSSWSVTPAAGPYVASSCALLGMVQSLYDEVAPFSIQVTYFEIGRARTRILANAKIASPPIKDYQKRWISASTILMTMIDNEPESPKKVVELMIDVLKSEGQAAGKTVPKVLPIGMDARLAMTCRMAKEIVAFRLWQAVISHTSFSGPS